MEVAFTRMSPKGQVVIPNDVRGEVDFKPSDKFIVYGMNDTVIIKKVNTEKAKRELQKAFEMIDAQRLNVTQEEVEKEILQVRRNKKAI